MKRVLTGISALAILLPGLAPGQSTEPAPAFELADVHASPPGTKDTNFGMIPGGRFEARGVTMLTLIGVAYSADDDKILGGPAWLTTNRYDILAKAPADTNWEHLQPMLRALLADRFKLEVKEEKRDMPVFVMTLNKKPLKLQPAADPEGKPKRERGEGDPSVNNHVKCLSHSMADLGEYLAQGARNFVTHEVVDETGLKGKYDLQLDWMGIGPYRQAKANPDGPPAVSIFDSLEKLGLHLEEGKRPLPVVQVASVNETPTPNAEGVTAKIPTYPTEFDVVEVRPAKPFTPPAGRGGTPGVLGPIGNFMVQNGRVEIMSATLKGLMTQAFDLDPRMVVGGPKWLDEDRFDVIAKTGAGVPWDVMMGMLKATLIERFHIKIHSEDQVMPVYVLEAGKKPILKPTDGTSRSECKIEQEAQRYFVCTNTTMAQFAEQLPNYAGGYIHPPLLDLTGIKGAFDIKFWWTPVGFLQRNAGRGGAESDASTPVNELTMFEAVDKQLGLKVEEQKHPVPVTVIDSVEKLPAEK